MTGQMALPGIEHEAALRLYQRLGQARTNNGGTLSREEWLTITAAQFRAELTANCKKGRVKGARDAIFDALAEGCGLCLDQMTRASLRANAVAKADILAVSPNVTPAEIAQRISFYKSRHPSWPLTAPAIAKHWASLGPACDPTRTAKLDLYQEPKEWRSACVGLWGEDNGHEVFTRGWDGIGVALRADILRWQAK